MNPFPRPKAGDPGLRRDKRIPVEQHRAKQETSPDRASCEAHRADTETNKNTLSTQRNVTP